MRRHAAAPSASFSFPWAKFNLERVQLHLFAVGKRGGGRGGEGRLVRGNEAPEDHTKNVRASQSRPGGSPESGGNELGILLTRIVAFNFKPETIRVITVSIFVRILNYRRRGGGGRGRRGQREPIRRRNRRGRAEERDRDILQKEHMYYSED